MDPVSILLVDAHSHAFPYLGGASGAPDVKTHMLYLQHHLSFVAPSCSMKGKPPPPDVDVKFRVGRYGMLHWTMDKEECSARWMPAFLAEMEAPIELMLEYMNWAGVRYGVLNHAHCYGELNEYLSECVRKYPDRFIGTAQVMELDSHKEGEIDKLRHAIRVLGLKGLYYAIDSTDIGGKLSFDQERFSPFWDEVSHLRVPVIWDIGNEREEYLEKLQMLENVMKRYDIQGVLSHFASSPENPPKLLLSILNLPNVWLGSDRILKRSHVEEYPYPSIQKMIEFVYREIGVDRMLWGSDFPAIYRACTYQQSLDLFRKHCTFLSEEEKNLILGENARRVFDLP